MYENTKLMSNDVKFVSKSGIGSHRTVVHLEHFVLRVFVNISIGDYSIQFVNGRHRHSPHIYSLMLLVLMLLPLQCSAFLIARFATASAFSFVSPFRSA